MSEKNKKKPLQEALLNARLHDPFCYLGLQQEQKHTCIRVFRPHIKHITIKIQNDFVPMHCVHEDGIFEWIGNVKPEMPYRLGLETKGDATVEPIVFESYDAYAFPLQISDHDLYLFNEGRLWQTYRTLGSHRCKNNGVMGVRFAVWAPNAERVSVIGDFNQWDGRINPMKIHHASGVWELFIPELQPGTLYKFEIRNRNSGEIMVKTDPYANCYELRPNTAALTPAERSSHQWQDAAWLQDRAQRDWLHAPMNILEIHPGSWKRHPDGRFYSYRDLAEHLIPYVQEMRYTHIELMPISEHPLDESWGYQTTGYFAVTSRYGSPDDFKFFVNACHQANIGVILDWVPAHFPQDTFALARFDGTALYEHEDPRLGYHHDWGTYIFNFGRNEVKSFLLSSAHYWLAEYHLDGLRVDAVASMLYLDYSRKAGEWLPNQYGGRENLDAINFLRDLNIMVHGEFPGALTLAEESTAWPGVSRPTYLGGLGFSMKWNMGWMHDTLLYMCQDPIYRRYHQNQLTFSQLYAYSENFILPFSHDEVVHGKGSLYNKMAGDNWQKFANLRLLLTYQMTCPGKKLNFMGNEFGQTREWRINHELDWFLLEQPFHAGIQTVLRDLNRHYCDISALHQLDFSSEGFYWIDCQDADHSIISYVRQDRNGGFVVVVLNFTPVPRTGYRLGVPKPGNYREIFNSDSMYYGGSNMGNTVALTSHAQNCMGFANSLVITLPPLAGIILEWHPRSY